MSYYTCCSPGFSDCAWMFESPSYVISFSTAAALMWATNLMTHMTVVWSQPGPPLSPSSPSEHPAAATLVCRWRDCAVRSAWFDWSWWWCQSSWEVSVFISIWSDDQMKMLVSVLASSLICRTANTDVRLLQIKSGICMLAFCSTLNKEYQKSSQTGRVLSLIWCPKMELKQHDSNSEEDAQVYRWLQVTHHPKNADVVTVTTAHKQPRDFWDERFLSNQVRVMLLSFVERLTLNLNIDHISGVSMGAGPSSSPCRETGNWIKMQSSFATVFNLSLWQPFPVIYLLHQHAS